MVNLQISFGLPGSIPFCSSKYNSGTKYRRKFTLECIPDNCHLNHKKRCIGHVFSFSNFCNWKSFDISTILSSSCKVWQSTWRTRPANTGHSGHFSGTLEARTADHGTLLFHVTNIYHCYQAGNLLFLKSGISWTIRYNFWVSYLNSCILINYFLEKKKEKKLFLATHLKLDVAYATEDTCLCFNALLFNVLMFYSSKPLGSPQLPKWILKSAWHDHSKFSLYENLLCPLLLTGIHC